MRTRTNILQNLDWVLIALYMALVLIGWINIYAAVFNENHQSIFDISQSYGKQLLWIGTAILLACVILIIDSKFFTLFSIPIYLICISLLVAVLFIGKEIAGSKSWIQIGSFALQPAELAKFSTNLAIAKYLSTLNINMKKLKTKLTTFLILAIPVGLIILQNDTGSALVYTSFIFVMYREGLSGNILIFGVAAIILFSFALLFDKYIIIGVIISLATIVYYFIRKSKKEVRNLIFLLVTVCGFVYCVDYAFENVLEKHQRTRINVLYGKEKDIHGAGYNVHQSKIAIGSGGFSGKGFLNGTQTKFNFVPEQSTDFIFCTVGEEWGFIGTTLVILLFMALLIRIIFVAERQRSKFSRIYGYGVASILFFHFTINLGMTIGLCPVIGIPLPFMSYGGSSLWGFTLLLFIFIRQDAHRMQLL